MATQTESSRVLTWPLTGRRGELDDILESLSAGSVKAVVITGEPGVGKSRLARETLDRLAGDGLADVVDDRDRGHPRHTARGGRPPACPGGARGSCGAGRARPVGARAT